MKYMLYRYRSYNWMILGGLKTHPKLGDLSKKKQDISECLPTFKN
jgi:hypothetical protein